MRGPYKWVIICVLPVVIGVLIGLRFCDPYLAACGQPTGRALSGTAAAPQTPDTQVYSNEYAVPRSVLPIVSHECAPPCEKCPAPCGRTSMRELKAACFVPTCAKIRKIYSNTMGLYGLELSYQTWDWLYPWVSGSVLSQAGSSMGSGSHTRATVAPLGIGLKGIYHFKHAGVYIGAGPLYSYLRIKDHSAFVLPTTSRWEWGGIGKVGVILFSNKAILLDIFADYSYMKFNFPQNSGIVIRNDVDFSGWSAGASLGLAY